MPEITDNFTASAEWYDAIYAARGKDYAAEAAALLARIDAVVARAGRSLLDVACGTGAHLEHLAAGADEAIGVDRNPAMLAVARRERPGVRFVEGDMTTLDLGRSFDVVTCLFASVAYLPNEAALRMAIESMARHLAPSGLALVEPGLTPKRVRPPRVQETRVEHAGRSILRRTMAARDGDALRIRFDFVASGGDRPPEVFTETHVIRLFTDETYRAAFAAAGLRVEREDPGISGTGLYVARHDAT